MHSPAWSESSSSSAVRRAARMSSLCVTTTIPSAAGSAHDGESVRFPSTWTQHRKQAATGSRPSTWHSVGIEMPSRRAASSTVVPASTETGRPSIVR